MICQKSDMARFFSCNFLFHCISAPDMVPNTIELSVIPPACYCAWFTPLLFLATKVAISFLYYSPKTIKCTQKPKIEKKFTGIDQSSERVLFSTSYLQLALGHARDSRDKNDGKNFPSRKPVLKSSVVDTPFGNPTTWDIDISIQRPRVSSKFTILEPFVIFLFVTLRFK